MSFTIDIRNKDLRGKRVVLDARTDSQREYEARKAMIYDLIDGRRFDIIERIRSGELHIADVRAALKDKRKGIDSLTPPPAAKPVEPAPLLEVCVKRVLKRTKGESRAGTLKNKAGLARIMLQQFGKDREVTDITSEERETFLFGEHDGRVWGPGRQEAARQLGKQAWDVAILLEREHAGKNGGNPRITANPWSAIRIANAAKAKTVRPAFLQREEWLRIERANEGFPELALLALGALAGLRQGEAVNLRLGMDVDLDRRLVRVQPRKGQYSWQPKTERSVRDVPMNDRLRAILKAHIATGYAGATYLLRVARRDRPISEQTAREWTERAFGRAGIAYGKAKNGLTNHSCRHTFASWLCQEDVQMLKVARLVGDTIDTVAAYYAHLLPADLDKAVRVLDRTLEPK